MKFCLSTLCCLAFAFGYAQLPVAIKDQFNNNAYGWWTGADAETSMQINQGKYVIQINKPNDGRYVTISNFNDLGSDFSIEASFIQQSGSTNNGFGLMWGSDGSGKQCEFIIASDGHFKIKNAEGGEQINKWFSCNVNSLGVQNVLRVESRNSKWYYFINDDEVAVTDAMPLYGKRIGFLCYTNMILEVDNFVFRQDNGIKLPDNLVYGLTKENLGPNVNSKYDELGPLILADGQTLYFGVKNSPENIGGAGDKEDIWYSLSNDGLVWQPRKNAGIDLNNSETNNLADISDDGKTLLFCQPNGFVMRKSTKKGWSEPERINMSFINEADNMEGNFSPDGKAILFTAKLKHNVNYSADSKEKDIYVTLMQKNGKWSDPINLGKHVNTAGDEISPFLAADGRTLYFGSNGRPGYGSYDIYMTRRTGESWTSWSEPVNLGPDINGPGFDGYYTLSAKADYAYLVSNVNSYGKSDIIRVKLPEAVKPTPVIMISGKTLNADTKKPLAAKIVFEELNTNEVLGLTMSGEADGLYNRSLTPGRYRLRAMADGYLPVIEEVSFESVSKYTEYKKNLLLVPIEVGEAVRLSHVYFQQGKSTLKPESYPELDRLAETMLQNPRMQISLEGHTDNIGNKELLMKLSQDRVAEVKAYLVSKGVNKDRISGRGYGPTKPLVANDTDEHREQNRRVEFKIIRK